MRKQRGNLLLEYLIASFLSILLLTFSIREFQRCLQYFKQLDDGLITLNHIRQLHLLLDLDMGNSGLTGCARYLSNEPIANNSLLTPLFQPNPIIELFNEKQAKSLFKITTSQPILVIKKTLLLGINFKNSRDQISLYLNTDEIPKIGDVLLLTNCQQLKLFKINYIRKSGDKYNIRFDDQIPIAFLNYLEILKPELVIYYNQTNKENINTISRKEFYFHRYIASELFTIDDPIQFSVINENDKPLLEINYPLSFFNKTRVLHAIYDEDEI